MRRNDWLVVSILALCVFGLVACGGSGSSGGSSSGTGSASGGGSEEEAALEFTECMRAHGVEVEDPKPGHTNVEVGGNDPATKKALSSCNGKLGNSGQELSSEEDVEFREGWLAFAKCVREHGVDMGDPEFLGPGKVHLDNNGIDPNSPAMVAAREACQGKTLELHGINIGG